MSKVISETRVTLHDGQYCHGVPSICGIDLPHRPHKFSPTPTSAAVEAAFRAGFKAGFAASGLDRLLMAIDSDRLQAEQQSAEDAAFKAAYPEQEK